jgi:hypothetical protein
MSTLPWSSSFPLLGLSLGRVSQDSPVGGSYRSIWAGFHTWVIGTFDRDELSVQGLLRRAATLLRQYVERDLVRGASNHRIRGQDDTGRHAHPMSVRRASNIRIRCREAAGVRASSFALPSDGGVATETEPVYATLRVEVCRE